LAVVRNCDTIGLEVALDALWRWRLLPLRDQKVNVGRHAIHRQEADWLDSALPLGLLVACLAVYLSTLAPSITWRHEGADSGELVAAAYTLGIPHPPGYPLYIMLGKLFTLLPIGEVARRLNLMSALFAAGAVVSVYAGARLVLGWHRAEPPSRGSSRWAAAGGALALAFSPVFWSQAVIAEVYALNACLVAGIIYLLLQATCGSCEPARLADGLSQAVGRSWLKHWSLALAAALLGLGLAHHLSIVLLVPGALLFLAGSRCRLRRYTAVAVAVALVLALGLYAYLPIRAVSDPPINWGNPRDSAGLRWMLLAEPYQAYAFAYPMARWAERLSAWTLLLAQQFTWPGVALGLLGLGSLWHRARKPALFFLATFLLVFLCAFLYNTTDSYITLIPSYLVFALWLAEGVHFIAAELATLRLPLTRQVGRAMPLLLLLLPGWLLLHNYETMDLSDDRTAYSYAAEVLANLPTGALIIADGDQHVFALWYYQYVIGPESPTVILAGGLLQFGWYQDTIARRYPQLGPVGATPDFYADRWGLIEANLRNRPVYVTDCDQTPKVGYLIRPAGRLCRVLRAETGAHSAISPVASVQRTGPTRPGRRPA